MFFLAYRNDYSFVKAFEVFYVAKAESWLGARVSVSSGKPHWALLARDADNGDDEFELTTKQINQGQMRQRYRNKHNSHLLRYFFF